MVKTDLIPIQNLCIEKIIGIFKLLVKKNINRTDISTCLFLSAHISSKTGESRYIVVGNKTNK